MRLHTSMLSRSHEEKFEIYNDALLHASQCAEMAQCTSKRCHKVRASIDHFVRCYGPRRTVSPIESCDACVKIWGLLCYHAKSCSTPIEGHCIVSQCDYLRGKIAQKEKMDCMELDDAREKLKRSSKNEWPTERRIAQIEADRIQALQLIAEIRAAKARSQLPNA
ncbi:hypothetical protein ABG067_005096 [Albugo candida]